MNKTLGQIAYEAAAAITGCVQPWAEANKAKWEAAANAVAVVERTACVAACHKAADALNAQQRSVPPNMCATTDQVVACCVTGIAARGGFVFIDGMPDADLVPLCTAMAESMGKSTEFLDGATQD